jgi:hypothetical protein
MPRSSSPTRRPATRGYTPRPGFLSIPTGALPNVPTRAYTLRTDGGHIVGFANPYLMTRAQQAAFDLQRRGPEGYNILHVVFAVALGFVVYMVITPFLGKGPRSVSPFVSSVRPSVPSVASISSNAVPPPL